MTEDESDGADYCFDNSLALVPVNMTVTSTSTNPKPVDESVLEALDALRLARKRLQSSLGTRQMIHVGLI